MDKNSINSLVQGLLKGLSAASPISDAAHQAAAAPTSPTKGGLQAFAEGALDVVEAVAPDLIGMIPGVGPIAKMVLSTLNDDEWFAEYKSAGATFNELLQTSVVDDSMAIIPAVARLSCGIGPINATAEGWLDSPFYANFMPSVLAYIREKTNNVLVEDPEQYYKVFKYASVLYAIYYNGKKYLELSADLPTNIPVLSAALPPLAPQNISAFRGVIEALGDYLKTTVTLPYAWTEYLRWRFGTTFCSDNTGKPGLILYDYDGVPMLSAEQTLRAPFTADPENLEAVITGYRSLLAGTGRAAADYKVAYKDHQIRWDVEKRHYDEKEYNLRINTAQAITKFFADEYAKETDREAEYPYDGFLVAMDSRLDHHAAIQAITLSIITGRNADEAGYVQDVCPFPITHGDIFTYVAKSPEIKLGTSKLDDPYALTGWYKTSWNPGFAFLRDKTFSGSYVDANAPDPDLPYNVYFQVKGNTGTGTATCSSLIYVSDDGKSAAGGTGDYGHVVVLGKSAPNAASRYLGAAIFLFAPEALQLHGTSRVMQMNGVSYYTAQLSYDQALLARSQVEAIQRCAMRNLTRGSYRMKTPVTQKPEVKEAVAAVETAAVADIEKQIEKAK